MAGQPNPPFFQMNYPTSQVHTETDHGLLTSQSQPDQHSFIARQQYLGATRMQGAVSGSGPASSPLPWEPDLPGDVNYEQDDGEDEECELPEDIQKHLAALSTLYRNTIGIVRRDQDGSYTRHVCHPFKEIQKACRDFKSSLWGKDERQKKTAVERLVKTGIIDLLCDVIVEGLESDSRSARDDDTTDSPLHIAAHILRYTFYPPSDYREVWCRVRDDVRLLPVLVNKLRDWYRPHMDNTLTESQGVLLRHCLEIIMNIAESDDKGRERLRQLGTTDVMLLYLASTAYMNAEYAAGTLVHIVTEEETSRLPTNFVNIVCDAERTWWCLGEAVRENDVIGRALIQNGIVDILMDRVRQTDDEHDKAGYLRFLLYLVTKKREHLAESTAQDLLRLACSVYGASPPTEPDLFYVGDPYTDGGALKIIFTLSPGLKEGPRFKFYQLILRSCEFDQRGAEASETGGKRKGNVSSSREASHSPPHSRSTSPVSPLCLLPASKDVLKLLDDAEATKDYVLLLKKLVSNRHGDLSERTKKDILCSACLTFGTAPASEIGREVDWYDSDANAFASAIINKLSPDLRAEPRFKVYEVILSKGGFEQQESEDEGSEKIRKRKKSSDSSMDESDSPPHSRSTSPVSPFCLLPASKDLPKLLDDADATDVYLSLLLRLVSQKSEDLPESTKDDIFRSVWLSVGSTMAIELHANGLGVVLQRDDVIGRTQIHNGIADILMDRVRQTDEKRDKARYLRFLYFLVSHSREHLAESTIQDLLRLVCSVYGGARAAQLLFNVWWNDSPLGIITTLSPGLIEGPMFKFYHLILRSCEVDQRGAEASETGGKRKGNVSSVSREENHSPPHSPSTCPVSPLCLLPASEDLLKLLDDAGATNDYEHLLKKLVSNRHGDLSERTKKDILCSACLMFGMAPASEIETDDLVFFYPTADEIAKAIIRKLCPDLLAEPRFKVYEMILSKGGFEQQESEDADSEKIKKSKESSHSSMDESDSPPHSPSTCPVSPLCLLPASKGLLKLLDDTDATNDYLSLLLKLVSKRPEDLPESTKEDILRSACLAYCSNSVIEFHCKKCVADDDDDDDTDDNDAYDAVRTAETVRITKTTKTAKTARNVTTAIKIMKELSPDLHNQPRFKLFGSELTGNDVIVRVLLERGVVSGLMERVRKTYNVQKKYNALSLLAMLCETHQHIMPPSVKQELLDLAVAVYRGHISIREYYYSSRDLATSILAALRDDLERAPTHRQLCLELGYSPVDSPGGGTGDSGRKRKSTGSLDATQVVAASISSHDALQADSSTISEPPTKRTATPLTDRQELSSTSTWHPPSLPSALSLTHYASSSSLPSSHPPQGSSPHNSLSECHRVPTQSAPHPASLPPVLSQLSSSQHSASQAPQPSCFPSTVPVSTVSVSGHRQHLGSTATAVGTSLDLSSLQPVHPIRRLPVHQHPSSSFTQPLTSAPFSRAVFPALPFPQQTSTPAQFLPAPFSVVPLPQQFPPSQMSMSQLQSSAQFDPSHFSSTSRDPAPLSDGPQPASFLSLLQSSSSPQDLSSQFPPPVDIASDPLPTQSTLAPPQSASWSQWRSSPRSSGQHAPLSPTLQIPDSPSGYVQLPAPPQPYDDMPCVDSTNRSSPPVEPDHGLSVVVSDHGNRQVSGCVPESAPWSTGNDVLMRNMETRIRDLEEQNVQYQEQNVQYQEQNVQYQEQNVQYQERLANLEDERKRLVQSNNDLKEELEGYKERSSEVDEERRKYQEKIRDLEQEQNRWREKTRELGEEHTRYIAKNRALEEEGRKQRGKCRQLRKVASSARENSSSSAPVTDPGPSTSQERSVTGPSTSQERSVTGPSTSQERNVTGPSTSQERNDGERKAGVYTQSEAENYGMVPLETDHPVYLYESQLQDAVYASRSNRVPCDGTRLARRLLHVFFTVEERRVGSISDTPKPGLVRLDKTVVDAILSCCLSRDLTTSRGKVRDAIASFLSAERCVAKQRETTKAKKAREVQAKCGAAKKTDSARKKKKRE